MIRHLMLALMFFTSCSPMQAYAKGQAEVPIVTVRGELDMNGAHTFERVMAALDRDHPKAIIVEINSPGGEYEAGFIMAKAIEMVDTKVVCVVDQEADSMGFYMLQSCDTRLMTKRSALMVHEPFMVVQGDPRAITVTDAKNSFQALAVSAEGMAEHEASRMRISLKDLVKKIHGGAQWWMGWKDAWEWGAVDGVVGSTREVRRALAAGKEIENQAKDIPQVQFPAAPVCEP
jgi:membrane-bound serine protease (ClpP class)